VAGPASATASRVSPRRIRRRAGAAIGGTLGAILSSRCGSTNRRVRRLANREPIAKRGHRDDAGGEPGVARNSSDSDPPCMPGVGVAGDPGAPGGTWAVGNPHVAHPARPTRNRAAPGGTAGWVARAALCVIAPLPPGDIEFGDRPGSAVTVVTPLTDRCPAGTGAVPPDIGGRTHDHLAPRLSGATVGRQTGPPVTGVDADT